MDVMAALQGIQGTMDNKMDKITSEVSLLRADFRKMNDTIKDNKEAISSLQSENKALKGQVQKLTEFAHMAADKLEDIEGRSRRNNVRIIGIPEKLEGPSVELYVENLILEELKPKGLSKHFTIERAHRIPGGKPKPGTPPRTIIARVFNYRDRDTILQEARKAKPVRIENNEVGFFPDFTLQVQRRRREFYDIKRRLREQNLKYAMLFPARLRVEADGKTHFFTSPEEAWEWSETRETARKKVTTRAGGAQKSQQRATSNDVVTAATRKVGGSEDKSKDPAPHGENDDTDWFERDNET